LSVNKFVKSLERKVYIFWYTWWAAACRVDELVAESGIAGATVHPQISAAFPMAVRYTQPNTNICVLRTLQQYTL
jgi:hypothetical protein